MSQWRRDSTKWIHDLGREASRHRLDLDVIRPCTIELARLAHANGHIMPTEADWRRCESVDQPIHLRRVLAYVHGHRLRLDLKFQELSTLIRRATKASEELAQDALIRSLEAFAELGLRTSRAAVVLQRIPGMSNYDRWCRAVCLHGVGIADGLPDQADRLLRICEEMSRHGEADAEMHYWRAFALRQQNRFEEALQDIDRAIEELPAGGSATREAYLLERRVIGIHRDLANKASTSADTVAERFQAHEARLEQQFAEYREELRKELERQTASARQVVPDSLRSMAVVLGLGGVLVGFLVTTVALALGADNPWLRSLWVAVILLGGVGLVVLMRWAAGPETGRDGWPREINPLRLLGFKRAPDEAQ